MPMKINDKDFYKNSYNIVTIVTIFLTRFKFPKLSCWYSVQTMPYIITKGGQF